MALKIPDNLKADMPQTTWGKILSATPVVMAVVATMLAGLSSSEMTRAQYDRSYAAQMQSKAADQWAFFQAKRLRGAMQHSTLEVMQTVSQVRPFDAALLKPTMTGSSDKALADSPEIQNALALLQKGELPPIPNATPAEPNIEAAAKAIEGFKSEAEITALLSKVSSENLDEALRVAEDHTHDFDAAIKPASQTLDRFATALSRQPAFDQEKRDFTAARLHYTEVRYEAEARLNQAIGNLYELKVRKNNISAERHHRRSQKFFYGMLAAQLAVIVSTFAMAARQRNFLWSLAAVVGLGAVAIAVYVYLAV